MRKNTTIQVPINSCFPNEYNSNKMSDIKFLALVDTIRRNGQTHPIQVVEERIKDKVQYRIVGGEHKWRAMKQLKMTEVDVIIRKFDDDVEEQLSSVEDNIHGSAIPIKEALIIASASKKYSLPQLQKRLGEETSDLKDKLLLVGQEEKLKKLEDSINKEHTVEFSLLLGTTAKDDAEKFAAEISKIAKQNGASVLKSEVQLAKGKDTMVFITFNVSELQKKVIDMAVEHIVKTEDVTKARAVELLCADYIAGMKQDGKEKAKSKSKGKGKKDN